MAPMEELSELEDANTIHVVEVPKGPDVQEWMPNNICHEAARHPNKDKDVSKMTYLQVIARVMRHASKKGLPTLFPEVLEINPKTNVPSVFTMVSVTFSGCSLIHVASTA